MAKRRLASDDDDAPKKKLNKESLKELLFLFSYLKPYKGKFALSLLFLVLSTLTANVFPFVIGQLVDSAIPTGISSGFQLPTEIQSQLKETQKSLLNLENINSIALILFVVLGLQSVFSFFRVLWFTEVGEKSLADLRQDLYARLIRLPMSFFTQRRVGELASRISADIALIQDTLTFTIVEFLRSIINLMVGIAVIFFISVKLTLVMLAVFPVLVVAALFFGRFIRKISKESSDQLAQSGVVVEETLQGILNVKAFANERFEYTRYAQTIQQMVKITIKGATYRSAFVAFVIFALFGSIIFILWYGVTLVQSGDLSTGKLITFVLFTTFVGAALGSFGELYSQIQKTIGATERVRELLRESTENVSLKHEDIRPENRITGKVAFRDVSFAYPSRTEIGVLTDLSFEVTAGKKIALVGPSGAGKSTIVSLLLRLYDTVSGSILIDDRPISDFPLSELRSQMAIVPQDVFLFGGTVKENIAYGKLDATDEEIIEAAKRANAHQFITEFPEGYQAIVGERGIKLSGGQRQRIAIARAVLRNPRILILDEATSALDSESEKSVQEALEQLMQGRTTFIIAHRLATVRRADQIVVIRNGKAVEKGTHNELIQLENGLYKSLAALQFTEEW